MKKDSKESQHRFSESNVNDISLNNYYNLTEGNFPATKLNGNSTSSTKNLVSLIKMRKFLEVADKTISKPQLVLKLESVDLLKRKSKSLHNIMSHKKKVYHKPRMHKKFKTLVNLCQISLNKGSGSYKEPNLTFREYMEDYTVSFDSFPKYKPVKEMALYVVCDGHSGEDVAKLAVVRFPELFHSFINENECEDLKERVIEQGLIQCFKKLDDELVSFEEIGSTINVIFMQYENNERVAYSANLGDSRSVIIKKKEAIRLSYDHKSIDKLEIERVKKEGGIILRKRFYGALAITRALGDYTFKIDGCGLSNIPHIKRVVIEKDDRFIIMGSDGIWDVINEEKAYKFINENPQISNNPESLSKFFVEKAAELGSKDNICCIAIKLN